MSDLARNKARVAALGAGSAALLLGALIFQYYGYAPCKMCLWQRWPHGIAMALAFAYLIRPAQWLKWLGGLAVLAGAAIAFYHGGVEQSWWEGPQSCTSSGTEGVAVKDLLDQILAAPVVRCDEIVWSLLGISMAGWNGIFSIILAAFWLKPIKS